MDSEEPVEGEVVTSVLPQETVKEPESEIADSAVEAGTQSTMLEPPSDEQVTIAVAETGPTEKVVFHRANSAPLPAEQSTESLLSQEALKEVKNSTTPQVPDKSTSLSSVGPEGQTIPGHLSSLSEGEFEEFINSPRGQNVIVERSPGGRYVRFMEKLGSGASKDVYRAYDTTEGIEVAWNVVNLAGVPKAERNRIVNEVRLLERLHHHNIISFHGSWVNRERQEVNFVTEILSSGTLKSFIDKVQVIRWKIAKRWARQILAGLAYLHEQDPPVIHRDLKCDNIFINGTSGDLRIGDLGLSTVHRNGKVLSVLGTPEFMAPDLYEETSYDEKVDIYAFGMALLEIFTKDIPYRECSNPAQIYRKVIRGEPPESLARVRSKDARDFISLCLGYKDEETGKYVRPTAAELLNHPFLGAGADDESEVEVDPPLIERTIPEEGSGSDSQRKVGVTTKMKIPAPQPGPPMEATGEPAADKNAVSQQVHSPSTNSNRSPVPPRHDGVPRRPNAVYASQNSLDDDSDHFDEMPDSEVNIVKKVKVMMGRGQELENTEDGPPPSVSNVAELPSVGTKPDEVSIGSGPSMDQVSPPSQVVHPHYLVAAAVLEDESPSIRPYKDDILKLVIRLPVEGQTQNVQFDFHLIEDDPVQVAKEMVTELRIPQDAILEISETISGHARNARMKQEKYMSRQKWQQEQQMTQNVQGAQQPPQQRGMMQQQNVPLQSQRAPGQGNEGFTMNQHQMQPPPGSIAPAPIGGPQQPLQHHSIASHQGQLGEGQQFVHPPPQMMTARSTSGGQMQQPVYSQTMAGAQDGNQMQQQHPVQQLQHGQHHHPGLQQPQAPVHQAQLPVQSQVQMQQSQLPVQHQQQQHVSNEAPYPSGNPLQFAPTQSQGQPQPSGQVPIPQPQQQEAPSTFVEPQPVQPDPFPPPQTSETASLPQGQGDSSQDLQSKSVVHENGGHDSSIPARRPLETVESGPSSDTDGVETNDEYDDEDDSGLREEIKRLDEDFKKNMLRAQKVFDSRMDNLQRSKEEREAQHLKTLEKHEKERAEFEKRLKQAEKEQNRRIEQLQREWDKKRESLAKHKGGGKRRPGTETVKAVPTSAVVDVKMSELTQQNAESLGTMTSSASRERLAPLPTHKKTPSMNNSESSQRSRSSSSTSLNGDSGSNSDHGGVT